MHKLKYKEIKTYREEQLQHQSYKCALCGEIIQDDAVLDHCHKTGKLRQVLHRGCNSMLGKIENNMPRSQMTIDRLKTFAERLVSYMETQHTEVLHPTYKTKEERKMRAYKKKGKTKPPKKY